tara:strand:- start:26 stop:382 length:357 start_codon:yes stop_codon:yes gene_type:complete
MTLIKTVMGRDAQGNAVKELEIYTFVTAGGSDETFDCHGAKSAWFMSNKALTVKLPTVDTEGEITTTEIPFVVAAASGVIVDGAASEAGHIASTVMPPFFVLTVGGSGASVSYCYITY